MPGILMPEPMTCVLEWKIGASLLRNFRGLGIAAE